MKAALLKDVNDIGYVSVKDPELRAGDMLVKVRAATICGTDIRILRGTKTAGVRYPSVLGHEFSGEVVDTGGHTQFRVGQAVAVCPAFACGTCDACVRDAENLCQNLVAMGYEIDGAFAEYARIPAHGVASGNVFALPEGASFETAALAEPLACVMNGQERVGIVPGDTVVVLGAGPIGLLHVKLARHAGAARIIVSQSSPLRQHAALAAGADLVIDPKSENVVERVRAESGGKGVDVVICAIGVPALANDAIAMVRPRGRVSLFAGFSKGVMAELDVNAIHYGELMVTGAFGLSRRQFKASLDLIASGAIDVKPFITHRFDLSDIAQALSVAEKGPAIKVVINGN